MQTTLDKCTRTRGWLKMRTDVGLQLAEPSITSHSLNKVFNVRLVIYYRWLRSYNWIAKKQFNCYGYDMTGKLIFFA